MFLLTAFCNLNNITDRSIDPKSRIKSEKKVDDDFNENTSIADNLFDWYMEPGVLAREDIEKGFTIVFSRDKSSKENLSLCPLYFKFHEKF